MALMAMGNVVLAVTGAEALYADMGHFGRKPIQRAWFAFVLPALVLNYFGQGALILAEPEAAKNPFFLSAPEWALYPLVALSTLATVIASQAVISGAFSVTRQAMQLGFVPRMEVQHTSDKEQGQIYLPAVNWGLMVAVMILVLGFKSSNNLAAAYGIAVTGDMVITSILATVVVAKVWKWGWVKAGLLFACFLAVELVFLAANILKIPDGGWFPLLAGMAIFIVMMTWKRGRQLLSARLQGERLELSMFLDSLASSMPTRVAGTSVFLNADPKACPQLAQQCCTNASCLLCARCPLRAGHDRVEVHQLKELGAWSSTVSDDPTCPVRLSVAPFGLDFSPLETSYFIGRETLIPRLGSEMAFWREKIFVAMFRNAGSATAFFKIPSNRVVELGTQVVL
jgi:KUP system potassium uptake protein